MKTTAFFVVLLSTLLFLHGANAAVSCGEVTAKAAPCIGFATGKVPKVPQACCGGLQQLAREATTTVARRTICQCMEKGVKAFPGVADRFLAQIPRACGIKVGFPVSRNTNCNKIN